MASKATPHECADRRCGCTQYEARYATSQVCTCGHEVSGHRHYTWRKTVVTIDEAGPRITNRKAFRTQTGSMRGVVGGAEEMGHLPEAYREEAGDAEYVVYSYQTPIAWITADGQRVIPDIGYSLTTGSHQGTVKHAWQGTDWVGSTFPVRGRQLRPAGGARRNGGMDDPYPSVEHTRTRPSSQWPAGLLERAPLSRPEPEQPSYLRGRESWEYQGDAFHMNASVETPDLDVPWHLRAPARGASYPPMGEEQG